MMDEENDAVIESCKELNKTIKYWKVCAERLPGEEEAAPAEAPAPAPADGEAPAPAPQGLEEFVERAGNPAPHLEIWLGGQKKAEIEGANAPQLQKLVKEYLEGFGPAE